MKPDLVQTAYTEAKKALSLAYNPYSGFFVGACVVDQMGRAFSGCNIENASYGATICAERTAIFKAVAEGSRKFMGLVIVTDVKEPAPPCAACLQVVAEFCEPDFPVFLGNLQTLVSEHKFSDFLPFPFGPKYLKS